MSGCPGNATSASTVEVHIAQNVIASFANELVVTLIAPDASTYILDDRPAIVNIDKTYVVDLSSEVAAGTWTLRVQDTLGIVTFPAYIISWTLNLRGAVSDCMGTNGTDVTIPDRGTAESAITISGCSGNASSASALEVHIVHANPSTLMVSLIAPDGSSYMLHDRTSTGHGAIDTVDLSSEAPNGTWRLRVFDGVFSLVIGRIDSWTLSLGSPPVTWWTTVDNSSTSFRASANWSTSTDSSQRYGVDYRFANPQSISDPAWYSADLPATGTYQVEAWYPASSANNDRAPYIIVTSSGNQSVYVNQRSGGGRWVNLGTFPMTGGAHDVVAVSRWTAGTGYVIADAVRITRMS